MRLTHYRSVASIAAWFAAVGAVRAAEPSTIPGKRLPEIKEPVLLGTAEADAIAAALQVFPPDNAWNTDISRWPLHPNSAAIVASIGNDKPLRYNTDMSYVFVPPGQKLVDVAIVEYPDESDKGPYPVPDNTPIEGWPAWHRRDAEQKLTLEEVQRDKLNQGGDRHAIVVDPYAGKLYEFYQMKRTDPASGEQASGGRRLPEPRWQCACAAIFNLRTNDLRQGGWTSADAAGLPIYPAVIRYDELAAGKVNHAMRVTVRSTRRAYVAPATHFASRKTDENLPRMGERLRLKAGYDIRGFSPEVQTILKGLKQYGMLVADNGLEWAISCAPDERIPVLHEELRRVKGSAFEVVRAPER
ncbi:MAG TPA: hypothetical protein VFV87_00255 [Pirellulaceae bacterium]|nr:hypothetical protein [Pirellulaceae bacterium]